MKNIKTESVRVDSSYSPIPQKETNLEQESQADMCWDKCGPVNITKPFVSQPIL